VAQLPVRADEIAHVDVLLKSSVSEAALRDPARRAALQRCPAAGEQVEYEYARRHNQQQVD